MSQVGEISWEPHQQCPYLSVQKLKTNLSKLVCNSIRIFLFDNSDDLFYLCLVSHSQRLTCPRTQGPSRPGRIELDVKAVIPRVRVNWVCLRLNLYRGTWIR